MQILTKALVAIWFCTLLCGCGKEEMKFNHEMKVFALSYHNYFAAMRVGPSSLDDLVKDAPSFSTVAERIRNGSLVVIWQGVLLPTAEENSKYYLGYESGIEEKGGWVMRADGRPVKMSPAEFKELVPLPKK